MQTALNIPISVCRRSESLLGAFRAPFATGGAEFHKEPLSAPPTPIPGGMRHERSIWWQPPREKLRSPESAQRSARLAASCCKWPQISAKKRFICVFPRSGLGLDLPLIAATQSTEGRKIPHSEPTKAKAAPAPRSRGHRAPQKTPQATKFTLHTPIVSYL